MTGVDARHALSGKPPWIRVRLRSQPHGGFERTRGLMRRKGLHTVCEEASCPNIGGCWADLHAAVMILGSVCTRACAFCNVKTGAPERVDPEEPRRLAEAVAELGLRHVVLTSVDRDDLFDGGAGQFVHCIEEIRRHAPAATIEVLTPDFRRKRGAVEFVAAARPDVYNHNLETVQRLYRRIRPGASYRHSIDLLRRVKALDSRFFTKSGLMVGLGESRQELHAVMDDLRSVEVDSLTIGQYLRPSPRHAPVERYWEPQEFEALGCAAREKGFRAVSCSPMTRSSYCADQGYRELLAQREAEQGPL